VVSPNATLPGSSEARAAFLDAGVPVVAIGVSPSKKSFFSKNEEGKQVPDVPAGLGFILLPADPMIGARAELLDPTEMVLFNTDVLRVLSATGAIRALQEAIDSLIADLVAGGEAPMPPLTIPAERAGAAYRSRLIELDAGPARCVFLKGNHEDMFLDFLGLPGHHGAAFLANGGAVTLRSYGIAPRPSADLRRQLPPAHMQFFERLGVSEKLGRSICVHAGLRPGVPLDEQKTQDVFWIREEFFASDHDFGATVIYGHTPRRAIDWAPPLRIGLDTGLVYGGCLSCLELRSATLHQIARRSTDVEQIELAGQLGGCLLV